MDRPTLGAVCLLLVIAGSLADARGSGPAADRDEARADARDRAPAAAGGKIDLTEPGIMFDYDDTVMVEKLETVVLIPRDGSGDARPETAGVVENRVGAPDEAVVPLKRYLGHEVSLQTLNQLMRAIVLGYRDAGRPVVDVFFPEQDITDGVVRIHVVEGVLGEVRVEGAERSDPARMAGEIRLAPGDPIRTKPLSRDLRWLNENYFRSTGLVYESGTEEGTTDIILTVTEADPFRVHAGFGNTGVELTGVNEWSAGFLWGDVLGTEAMLAYTITRDYEFDTLISHSGYARAPLPWRHLVEFFVAHVETGAEFPLGTGSFLDVGGQTTQVGGGYIIPLDPLLEDRLTHNLTFGVDYTSTNNDIAFGGASVLAETAAILQARAEYEFTLTDKSGQTAASLGGVYSPGNLIGNNDEKSFNTLRAGADPDYFYAVASVERTQRLPWMGLELKVDLSGQWSDRRLIANEQLLIGGYNTVRGYDESVLRGDIGALTSAELYFPALSVPMPPRFEDDATVRPYLFYDLGWVDAVDPAGGETAETLTAAGLGLRYKFGELLSLRAEYGWGLEHPDSIENSQKLHFLLEVRF